MGIRKTLAAAALGTAVISGAAAAEDPEPAAVPELSAREIKVLQDRQLLEDCLISENSRYDTILERWERAVEQKALSFSEDIIAKTYTPALMESADAYGLTLEDIEDAITQRTEEEAAVIEEKSRLMTSTATARYILSQEGWAL